MDTLRDLLTSLKTHLRDRLSNPIYGSFVLAWSILNFRLLLVLIGDGKWAEKISYIDTKLYPRWTDWAVYGYVIPLVAALLYVLVSPFANRAITRFLRLQDKETATMLLDIEGEIPISKPEAELLRKGLLAERQLRIAQQQEASATQAELARQIDVLLDQKKGSIVSSAKADDVNPDDGVDQPKEDFPGISSAVDQEAQVLRLFERDFVGVAQSTVLTLASRGLGRKFANALYEIRNGITTTATGLKQRLNLDDHQAKVVIDQLIGLKVAEWTTHASGKAGIKITTAGTQALEALLNRGFKPEVPAATI